MLDSVRRILALAVPVLLLASCSEGGTSGATAPDLTPGAPAWSVTADLSPLARFSQQRSITIAWAKKWIGPEGGRLDFQGFAVVVPAGAVDKVTQFSIRLPVEPNESERVVAEFGPHGSTFLKPVTIELPYASTSIFGSSTAKVVWWDGSAWVGMGGTPTADQQRLSTRTSHFSTYGTTDENTESSFGGGLTASGG